MLSPLCQLPSVHVVPQAAGPQPAPARELSTSPASRHRVGSAQGAAMASVTFFSAETGDLSLAMVGNVLLSTESLSSGQPASKMRLQTSPRCWCEASQVPNPRSKDRDALVGFKAGAGIAQPHGPCSYSSLLPRSCQEGNSRVIKFILVKMSEQSTGPSLPQGAMHGCCVPHQTPPH